MLVPLLPLYRADPGLSAAALAGLFGVYAVGLTPALLVSGPLSDRVGRRRVIAPVVVVSAATSVLFAVAAHSVPLLFAARFGQGVVAGFTFSVCSAWLYELSPVGAYGRAARLASFAMTASFAASPLVSGGLATAVLRGRSVADRGALPTTLPFLVHVALLAAAFVVLRTVPETVARATPATAGPVRLGLPAGTAGAFWGRVVPPALAVYTFPSTAVTVLPLLTRPAGLSVALTGLVGALALGSGAVAQSLARALAAWAATVGAAAGTVGYLLATLAVHARSEPLVLVACAVLGAGGGLSLTAGLTLTQALADDRSRGAVSSLFYIAAYLGFGAPLLLALLVTAYGKTAPLLGLAAVFAVSALWLAVPRRPQPAQPAGPVGPIGPGEPV